ncbi:MAG: sugar ABC transporter substrate-binding protein [Microbacterium sp. SCN 70-18]|uniref:Autoinducer 2 ABC transporter substrate-binding protein n=1 Tax=Microbacterium aurantiacum TaxID=162393 RepID=A0AAJ2HJ23_9MICO|nr:autoinducer 2 ABC transporter substrate-binding protein [Microbacterium aurantiacum]MBN9201264.1 autoinducer 2 ABC transporter substrate-binding protein [Microbacterium chocolatum]MDS0245284.1 autoinducer 2 ABC transporter substrate-binding protein [Microbacterium aurantiacum]ODT11999.1 MAG: sugar ABC transporter substrate-binding protein [Microbacterium sp. SCN 70-18]
MKRARIATAAVAVTALAALTACSSQGAGGSAGSDGEYVTVVKLQGISWFDRMGQGLDEAADDLGLQSSMVGPDDASPEKQVKIIQDLIARQPAAIAVVPLSPQSIEGVLGQAKAAGIKVVTHEAPGQANADVDIEAFDNAAYGEHMMQNLADCMGGEGQYVTFVGSLTAASHMEWAQAELDYAAENYPGITRVADPIETTEDLTTTYDRAKEILAKYPDIKGFLGSAASDVAGIGRAIEEAGLEDDVCVMGTSIPSTAGKYLESGAVDKFFFWDPAITGRVLLTVSEMLVNGEEITVGTDLGIEGYEDLQAVEGAENSFHGNAWIDVDSTNVADYDF